jgi:CelD/BcsL family acetyltransferase involved in cellulose biosynthesis
MRVEVVDPGNITGRLAGRWERICRQNPALSSPYFTLPFIQTIARHRSNVFVAIIDGGAAFFAFQRQAFDFGIGRPVGSPMSDYHGIISPAGLEPDLEVVMRSAGLAGWEFDHVLACQAGFAPWTVRTAGSPVVDLVEWTGGSSSLCRQAGRKLRKLQREVGDVEFEFDCRQQEMLDLCLNWKSAQYERMGAYNIFARRDRDWILASLREIYRTREPGFSGCLSILSAGGRPVAAHFGMRSQTDLHYWFPAYDVAFSAYSPGISLLHKLAAAAAAAGLMRVDLGRGEEGYKQRFATATVALLDGRVVVHPIASALLSARKQVARSTRRLMRRPIGARRVVAPAD